VCGLIIQFKKEQRKRRQLLIREWGRRMPASEHDQRKELKGAAGRLDRASD